MLDLTANILVFLVLFLFEHDHGKRYMTSDEDHYRFSVFQSSLKKIKQHNEKYQNGEESYFLRTNQFADLTDEEFSDKFLGYSTAETRPNIEYIDPKVDPVPESIDWKEKGAVLSVKEQGECAAGWAFSVVSIQTMAIIIPFQFFALISNLMIFKSVRILPLTKRCYLDIFPLF